MIEKSLNADKARKLKTHESLNERSKFVNSKAYGLSTMEELSLSFDVSTSEELAVLLASMLPDDDGDDVD